MVSGHSTNLYFTFTADPSDSSIHDLTYAIPSGTEDTSRCGWYTLSSFLLIQGGLEGHYFTNRWFSGEPYLTQYDSLININWGEDDLIPNVASNYVSIEWEGFILPEFAEDYSFEVNCNDGVRLWINDVLLIDQLTDSPSDLNGHVILSDPISLTAGAFVPVRIQFYEAVDSAFIRLSWQSESSQTMEIIPSDRLYYKRSHTPISGATTLVETRFTPRRPTLVH